MKVTLKFKLPEDNAEHVRAINAQAAWGALDEIYNLIRNHFKYDGSDAENVLENINNVVFDAKQIVGD